MALWFKDSDCMDYPELFRKKRTELDVANRTKKEEYLFKKFSEGDIEEQINMIFPLVHHKKLVSYMKSNEILLALERNTSKFKR